MHTWKPTELRLSLGRGGGGFGGGGRSFERGFGVMTHRAPFENGMCGPNEEVGADGTCQPIMQMGQTGTLARDFPTIVLPVAFTAAAIGLAAIGVQFMTKESSILHKAATWAEIAALVTVAGMGAGLWKTI